MISRITRSVFMQQGLNKSGILAINNVSARSFAAAAASAKLEKNYYDILGVDTTATESMIKDAYRGLAKKYHPDVRASSDLQTGEHDPDVEKFRDVVEAYQVLSVKESRAAFDISMRSNPQMYRAAAAQQFADMMNRDGRDKSALSPRQRSRGNYAEKRMAELKQERDKYNANNLGYYNGGVPRSNRGPIRGDAMGRPGVFHSPQIHNWMNYQHGDSNRVTGEDAIKFKHFMGTDKADFNRTMPGYQMHYDNDHNYMKDRDFWLKFLLGSAVVTYFFRRYNLEQDRSKMHERMSGFENTPSHHVVNKGGVLLQKQFTGFKKYYKNQAELDEWYKMVYPSAFK